MEAPKTPLRKYCQRQALILTLTLSVEIKRWSEWMLADTFWSMITMFLWPRSKALDRSETKVMGVTSSFFSSSPSLVPYSSKTKVKLLERSSWIYMIWAISIFLPPMLFHSFILQQSWSTSVCPYTWCNLFRKLSFLCTCCSHCLERPLSLMLDGKLQKPWMMTPQNSTQIILRDLSLLIPNKGNFSSSIFLFLWHETRPTCTQK